MSMGRTNDVLVVEVTASLKPIVSVCLLSRESIPFVMVGSSAVLLAASAAAVSNVSADRSR